MLSPRHFLDAATEWRKSVWRRWLISYLVPPNQGQAGHPPESDPAKSPLPDVNPRTHKDSVIVPKTTRPEDDPISATRVSRMPSDATEPSLQPLRQTSNAAAGPNGQRVSEPDFGGSSERESERHVEQRRAEVRARFDALSDRLLSVEDMLDSISRRFASRESFERRAEQRMLEVVEGVAETCERQTKAIESSVAVMMRLEQRILRVLREEPQEARRSAIAPPPGRTPTTTSVTEPFFWDERRKSRPVPSDMNDDIDGHHSAYSIRGNLGEMSLPTVFSMLELERHTGRLIVRSEDGSLASFELVDGAVISSRLNETDHDPVHALRDSLKWTNGSFWLLQSTPSLSHPPPRTIGSLLLEATRQNDEANAADRLM